MTEAYPLYWPEGRARTAAYKRQASRFTTGFGMAAKTVMDEIRRLGGRLPIVSTNVPLRRDGLPLASAKRVDDPGVAVYFTYKTKQVCFACDRWNKVEDNIWAVAKTIEAMRGIARWGTGDMLDAAFTGFAALPAPGSHHVRPWFEVLGYVSPAGLTQAEVEARYRTLAREKHPDVGGSGEQMAELNAARAEAKLRLPA